MPIQCRICGFSLESDAANLSNGQCPDCQADPVANEEDISLQSMVANSADLPSSVKRNDSTQLRQGFHEQPTLLEIEPPDNPSMDSIWENENGTPLASPSVKERQIQEDREERIRQEEAELTGKTVGGYEIISLLGVGGMGSVCLARQKSLDRNVALKILPSRLASNPDFVVRFTREALSAAQITHHNVVQVYDVGSSGNTHFISMEYVRGQTLGEMVRRDGALHPDTAASYILQAARGLHHAHTQGIIHRDVKPDNLLINEYGIIKVADMGLAKIRDLPDMPIRQRSIDEDLSVISRARGDLTIAHASMGTPAYMAPEQARDAANVDPRADQYSLGCSLYYLIARRPPYEGNSALEIITQQMEAPAPNLRDVSHRVPGLLNDIMLRMLSKNPEDRFPTMKEVVEELEGLLGVDGSSGPYSPREQHLTILEQVYQQFYSAPQTNIRKLSILGFFTIVPTMILLGMVTSFTEISHLMFATLWATPVINVMLDGILNKNYLGRRLRGVLWHAPLKGWLKTVAAIAVIGLMLALLDAHWWWVAGIVFGGILAGIYQILVVRRLSLERTAPLNDAAELLKHLRLRGLSEEAVQDFVCRFSGKDWEELFEQLFGYEALIAARGKTAKTEHLRNRRQYAPWRDPIARWLDNLEEKRRREREHRTLAKAEARRLKAQGASRKEAARQAELNARAMGETIVRKAEKPTLAERNRTAPFVLEFKRSSHRETPMDKHFQGIRFVVGCAMLIYILAYKFGGIAPEILRRPIIAILESPLPAILVQMLLGIWGVAVCAALVLSAYTTRRISSLMVVTGAVIITISAWLQPAASTIIDLNRSGWSLAGAALMILGLLLALPVRIARRRRPPSLQ